MRWFQIPRGKNKSIRFGHGQYDLIVREAQLEGVSASQFIRDAAFARAVTRVAHRDGETFHLWETIARHAAAIEGELEDRAKALHSRTHPL